jgi:hypothetical protein
LKDLKGMTMTVIDGDFPPEILGRENLTFAEYTMPAGRNRPEIYDAKLMGPAPKKQGVLRIGHVNRPTMWQVAGWSTFCTILGLPTAVVGLVFVQRRRKKGGRSGRPL